MRARIGRWGPPVLRAGVGAALVGWAWHILTHFGPGEVRRGLEPFGLWPPLVALFGLAGGVAVVGAGLVGWRGRAGAAAAEASATPPEQTAPPIEPPRPVPHRWIDALVPAALTAAMYPAVGAWIAVANPHGVLIGMDGPSFLRTAIAVATGQWDHYNTDKRVLHAWLAAHLGDDPLATTQLLSHVAVAVLPGLAYLLARTVTRRSEALVVALVCALHPTAWLFATQSTNYALFFAVITASLASLTWALARPHPARWILAGLVAGLALSTQEKALLAVGPALAVGIPLALLGDRTAWRRLGIGLVAGLVSAVAMVAALDPPVSYTAFGSLVVNQREELHREMPWTWPVVREPDPAQPTPFPLPALLRGGEIEAALSAMTAPPDSNVLRFRPERAGPPWTVTPGTSMAPLPERIRQNLHAFEQDIPALPRTGLLLLLLGAAGLLLPGGRGAGRWLALVPAVALLSAWGALALRYNVRYFVHLVPVCALLGVVGLGRLLRLLVGPARGPRAVVAVAAAAFWLLYGHAAWTGSDRAWRAPTLPFPSPVAVTDAAIDPGNNAAATMAVTRWLATQDTPKRIIDCAPMPVWLFCHEDPRVTPPDGEHACAAEVAAPRPDSWLVASSHPEFRGPDTPHPETLVTSGRWRVVGGWDPQFGAITPQTPRWSTSAVVVLAPTQAPAAMPAGTPMATPGGG